MGEKPGKRRGELPGSFGDKKGVFKAMKDQMSAAEYQELKFLIPSRLKYRNHIVEIDGIKFRSKKEAAYYGKLKLLNKSGDVLDFKMQVKYSFEHNGVKICSYYADFVVTWKSGNIQVVDTKGFKTDMYKKKRAMMKAFYGIVIKEV